MAGNVSKHVAVMSELSRVMDNRSLMETSELEQELACNQNPSEAFTKVFLSLISLLLLRVLTPDSGYVDDRESKHKQVGQTEACTALQY